MTFYLDLGIGETTHRLSPDHVDNWGDQYYSFDPCRESQIKEFSERFQCAAWTQNGHANLSMNSDPNKRTLIPKNRNFDFEDDGAGVEKKMVKVIDFPLWMQEHLHFEDTIICAMSIEGAEYELLESLIKTKDKHRLPMISWIDHLYVEFNAHKMKEEFQPEFREMERWIMSECQRLGVQLVIS